MAQGARILAITVAWIATWPTVVLSADESSEPNVAQSVRAVRETEIRDFADIRLPLRPPAKGKAMLIVFVDLENRPSRHALQMLARSQASSLREDVEVIPIETSSLTSEKLSEWRRTLALPWAIGVVTGDPDVVRRSWGTKSLPWLILTDKDHVVRAEGFGLDELSEKVKMTELTRGD